MAAVVYANRGLVHSPSYALSPSCEAPLSFAKNRLFSLLPVFYSFSLSVCRFVHPAPELLLFVRAEQSRELLCSWVVRPFVRSSAAAFRTDSSGWTLYGITFLWVHGGASHRAAGRRKARRPAIPSGGEAATLRERKP